MEQRKAGSNSRCPFYRGVRLIEVSVKRESTVVVMTDLEELPTMNRYTSSAFHFRLPFFLRIITVRSKSV